MRDIHGDQEQEQVGEPRQLDDELRVLFDDVGDGGDELKNLFDSFEYDAGEVDDAGIAPYKCEVCLKTCKTVSNLTSHSKCHILESDMICCFVCERKFKRKNDLERHMDTQHRRKKYFCLGRVNDVEWGCGMKYSRTDALIKHWKCKGRPCFDYFKSISEINGSKYTERELKKLALQNIVVLSEY